MSLKLELTSVPGESECCGGPVWEIPAPSGPFRFCGRCSRQVEREP